jgi:beta-lactamase regulating signal transducer with metallopeptidase domain
VTLLHQVVAGWWAWMVPMTVQVTVLAAVVLLLDRLMGRRAWPALTSALWWLVLLKLALPPGLTSPFSLAQFAPARVSTDPVLPGSTVPGLLFGGWLVGGLGLAAGLTWRYRRLRRQLLATAEAAISGGLDDLARQVAERLGLARVPEIRVVRAACGPAVLGFWRPVVLLPNDLLQAMTKEQLEHVLLHELAHVRRRDPLAGLLVLAVQLVYWFHPAAWLARSRLATLREVGCDLAVAGVLREATGEYRRTLLHLARSLLARPSPVRTALFGGRSQLLQRLLVLERPPRDRPGVRYAVTACLSGVLLASVVPLAGPMPPAYAPAPPAVEGGIPADLSVEELPGCLPLRYVVFGMLAQEERRGNPAE